MNDEKSITGKQSMTREDPLAVSNMPSAPSGETQPLLPNTPNRNLNYGFSSQQQISRETSQNPINAAQQSSVAAISSNVIYTSAEGKNIQSNPNGNNSFQNNGIIQKVQKTKKKTAIIIATVSSILLIIITLLCFVIIKKTTLNDYSIDELREIRDTLVDYEYDLSQLYNSVISAKNNGLNIYELLVNNYIIQSDMNSDTIKEGIRSLNELERFTSNLAFNRFPSSIEIQALEYEDKYASYYLEVRDSFDLLQRFRTAFGESNTEEINQIMNQLSLQENAASRFQDYNKKYNYIVDTLSSCNYSDPQTQECIDKIKVAREYGIQMGENTNDVVLLFNAIILTNTNTHTKNLIESITNLRMALENIL